MSNERIVGWPEQPYKGLSAYDEEDALVFAGREDDIHRCASALADWKTRIFVLHGLTGCGKSSFLKAGVVPFIERKESGMAFARPGPSRELFITSTAAPLAKLASAVHKLVSQDWTITTPLGERALDLLSTLPEDARQDPAAFLSAVNERPRVLVQVLEELNRLVGQSFILIVDQGEEVLTLDSPTKGERSPRELFFEFLSELANAPFDVKLLVSLRTEYLGRFISHLRLGFRRTGIDDYYLAELDKSQVIEALERPTSRENIGAHGSPFERYRFEFEKGLIAKAVEQLDHAPQGRLGALQIVFRQLYEQMSVRNGPRIVTNQDLERVGNVEGSIERFVSKELRNCGAEQGLSPILAEREVTAWKLELCNLIRIQADGTATTEVRSASDLRNRLGPSALDFDVTAETLKRAGILKTISYVDRQDRSVPYFAIGHDTVGLVLSNWKATHDLGLALPSPVSQSEDRPQDMSIIPGKDIALCLSGIGYRAMLFNLGAVWRLHHLQLLQKLGTISGVSSGAIVAGVLATRWSELVKSDGGTIDFYGTIAAPLVELAGRTIDTTKGAIGALLGSKDAVERFDRELNSLFRHQTLQDLPSDPVFVFSATDLQAGSLFLMSKSYIGDVRADKARAHPLSIAQAVGASNSTPPNFPPMKIDWSFKSAYLVTGSLIDHLGLEAAWARQRTILISDGELENPDNAEPPTGLILQTVRSINVLDKQLRSLRRRQIDDAFRSQIKSGALWSIGSVLSDENPTGIEASRLTKLRELPPRFAKLDETAIRDLINLGYAACSIGLDKNLIGSRLQPMLPLPNL